MTPPAGTGCIVLLPFPARGGPAVQDRPGKFPGGLGRGPVLFLTMNGGDLYIRGDGASCVYVRKDPDDPDAVH
ncbi:hypothetical protein [Methanoregula sp. UBA64]|jgi:hypothetical protein|uniref:hypothetical protein n=1 Tax=Methanoregula sp. UBA64 TaxID=1915554 RepID=UPI0025D48684|nr:hypothetical protein [Methanoregula sp. UBA64]